MTDEKFLKILNFIIFKNKDLKRDGTLCFEFRNGLAVEVKFQAPLNNFLKEEPLFCFNDEGDFYSDGVLVIGNWKFFDIDHIDGIYFMEGWK